MGFEKFFGGKEKKDDPYGLKAERKKAQEEAPQGFLENLTYTIQQMKEKSAEEFWNVAGDELKAIVAETQEVEGGKTYYKGDILSALSNLTSENNWSEYKDVNLKVLENYLVHLYEDNEIGSPNDDPDPLEGMRAKD